MEFIQKPKMNDLAVALLAISTTLYHNMIIFIHMPIRYLPADTTKSFSSVSYLDNLLNIGVTG
jgi:hypothetical protein